ncbi:MULTISPECIES: class I adenylate-forming enzyme family protein [unclassified Streptomyces]|uniref:class I adenylate-forming enzyme family protein n=1 Tax=unclassified Streptomyces TaxID=2593676 RepID=UPI0036ED7B59
MRTFKELLLWAESGYGDKEAVVDLDRGVRWTYADLNSRARSVAAGLSDAGLVKGDRIAWLAMAPGSDLAALTLGAKKAGLVLTVMNGRASVERLAWMITNVGARLLAYTAETAELLDRVRAAGIPTVERFLALDEPVQPEHLNMDAVYGQYGDAGEPAVDVQPDDISHVIYTSGSSGPPKPVMFTEQNWLESQRNMAYAWSVFHEDHFLNYFPPHFAAWLSVQTTSVIGAASQVCMRFDPLRVAAALTEEQCTHLITTPTMVRMLRELYTRDPGTFAGNRMRVGMLGGETITQDVLDAVGEMFPSLQLMGSFGATESGGAMMHTGLGNERVRHDDGRLVGKPMPGITAELRDPDSGELIAGPDRPGELYVRGPIASGIWGDEELTTRNFPDGWWRSGDLLVRDKDGYFSFAGRGDNVFKSGAIKISTEDVETVLKAHPQVLDAVVVAVPDDRFGSVPHAFVRHRGELGDRQLVQWWSERADADAFARPRHWTLMGEEPFPMVTTAKVDRFGLRQRAVALGEQARSEA